MDILLFLAVLGVGDAGRRAEYESLYRELYLPVVGYFLQKGLTREESEELAQEAFVLAFRSFASFRGDAKRSTWLFSIVKNLWRNRLRDRSAAKRRAEELPISEAHEEIPAARPAALEEMMVGEQRRLLAEAVGALPKRMRECVRLRIYQGLSFREIAQILGIGESAAKTQVSLARNRLKQTLADRAPSLLEVVEGTNL